MKKIDERKIIIKKSEPRVRNFRTKNNSNIKRKEKKNSRLGQSKRRKHYFFSFRPPS